MNTESLKSLPCKFGSDVENLTDGVAIEPILEACDGKVLSVEETLDSVLIELDSGSIVVKTDSKFLSDTTRLIASIAELTRNGINPFDCQFFLTSHATGPDYPGDYYTFFVVYDDAIVCEKFKINLHHDDPEIEIFKCYEDPSMLLWSDDLELSAAHTIWCYNKFMSDTKSGQIFKLMQNRYSNEELGKLTLDSVRQIESGMIAIQKQIRILIIILVIVAVVYFQK
ncbi:MAG: hypothetical protein ACXW04_11850 [Methylobacter sp.]